MKRLMALIGTGLLYVASPWILANDKTIKVDSGAFEDQRNAVLSELSTGTEYAEISDEEKQTVIVLMDRMQALVGIAESVDSLPESDRIQLFNDQEQVNAILTRARDDSRLICRRETVVGSRLSQTICLTAAERRLATDRSQDLLRRNTSTQPLRSR